ncbi:hypothetical protein [Streptomyces sp. NPDC004579]|uniref:hypothetical protein n=1 Tax=Streptomyces sp. NPDC004579 TaxID=3154667 RepID=UPI0033B227E6
MFAASGLVRALGPAQTPMTVEAHSAALGRILDGTVDWALLERARAIHRASHTVLQRRLLLALATDMDPNGRGDWRERGGAAARSQEGIFRDQPVGGELARFEAVRGCGLQRGSRRRFGWWGGRGRVSR